MGAIRRRDTAAAFAVARSPKYRRDGSELQRDAEAGQ